MKQDNFLNKIKAGAFDWVFKGLIAVVCFLVKDMREDIKQLMQAVPALQAKVEMINDQRLIDKFRGLEMMPRKEPEQEITYDSIKHY
jgi:hypothetical protein